MLPRHTAIKEFCARVLPVCPDGKVIVIQKNDGHLQIPGGGSETKDGGDPALTALRELEEEVHIKVVGSNPKARLIEVARKEKDDFHTWVCYKIYLTQDEVECYQPEVYENGILVGMAVRLFPKDIVALYADRMTEAQYAVMHQHMHDSLS